MKEAIVLAGGRGTRLQSVVSDVPKPMAPIHRRPFLTYLFDMLIGYGYEHVVLSTGYMHEVIESYFGSRYRSIDIDYAQEMSPLGTGGGLLNAMDHCRSEEVTVLNGDTLFRIDFDALYRFHQQHKTLLTIVLRKVEDTSRYGSVVTNAEGRISSFVEKGDAQGTGFINGGIYLLNSSIFEGRKVGDVFSFERDIMQVDYPHKPFYAIESDGYFIDIGIPEDYARAQNEFISL